MAITASIVILNWNGWEVLKESVPAALRAIERAGGDHEVLVVDNGSRDGSVERLREQFPAVRVLALESNLGFSLGNNRGVEVTNKDVICLINNDCNVHEDYLLHVLPWFQDAAVFAVSPRCFRTDRTTFVFGRTLGRVRFGYLAMDWSKADAPRACPTLYASGGSGAFRRQYFLELGGLDVDLTPNWEDVDLGYRAWRRGWSIVYEPAALVYHDTGYSLRKAYRQVVLRTINSMHHQMFNRKNVNVPEWRIIRALALPLLFLCGPLLGSPFRFFAPGLLRMYWTNGHRRVRRLSAFEELVGDVEILRRVAGDLSSRPPAVPAST